MSFFLILSLFGVSFAAFSQTSIEASEEWTSDEEKRDIREECRADIAGAYFELLNRVERDSAFVVALKARISTLKKGLISARQELGPKLKERDQSSFNLNLERSVDALQSHIKLLEKRMKSENDLLAKYAKTLKYALRDQKSFKSRMDSVFKVMDDQSNQGYKKKIVYRHSCHRFEFLCPLPKAQARVLENILENEKVHREQKK